MSLADQPDWEKHGIRIVRSNELDLNTPQTPGMTRAAAITYARAGAQKLWAGTVVVQPAARTGPHHHGELETVLYIVRGRARFRWGDRLEFVAEAGPGDFIYVPPFVPLEKIRHKFQLTKVKASKMIIGLALEKKIKLVDVTKFYQEVWSNLSFESGQRFSQLRLDWTPEENALLLIYAKHLFSSNTRTASLRFYAVQNKFAVVEVHNYA